jgi:hypothetical protein
MAAGIENPKSRHTGRVPKLTPELQKLFFEALRLTGFQRHAAMACGVQDKTVCLWKTKGRQQKSGIYRTFVQEFDKFRAEPIAVSAELHHQVAHGEIYKGPRYVYMKTARGGLVRTSEIEKDEKGDPVIINCCDGINLKAIEWELARLDPQMYALRPRGVAITNINANQQNIDARPMLIDVLKKIGTVPEESVRRVTKVRARSYPQLQSAAIEVEPKLAK